eukprot:m.143484 g.143484  ORF g.143484 m.143484 type:complete len:95 (+) comp16018_c0_seq15:283-567(+)
MKAFFLCQVLCCTAFEVNMGWIGSPFQKEVNHMSPSLKPIKSERKSTPHNKPADMQGLMNSCKFQMAFCSRSGKSSDQHVRSRSHSHNANEAFA